MTGQVYQVDTEFGGQHLDSPTPDTTVHTPAVHQHQLRTLPARAYFKTIRQDWLFPLWHQAARQAGAAGALQSG